MPCSTDKPIPKPVPTDRQSVKDGVKDLKNTPPKKFSKAKSNQFKLKR
jgi:hypothetical protein